MLTLEQIFTYLEEQIAAQTLTGNKTALRQLQTAAGVLMAAAEANHDNDTAHRLRVLAAHAANRHEELANEND